MKLALMKQYPSETCIHSHTKPRMRVHTCVSMFLYVRFNVACEFVLKLGVRVHRLCVSQVKADPPVIMARPLSTEH